MAKKWAEIAGSSEFQALPSADQEATRMAYFREVVAPTTPAADLDATFAAFDADTKPGLLKRLAGAAAPVASAVAQAARGIHNNAVGVAGELANPTIPKPTVDLPGSVMTGMASNPPAGPVMRAAPPPPAPEGLLVAGNVDLTKRPRVQNADGSVSTVRSISVNIDGKETLIPTVSDDGRILTNDQAVELYRRTGKHLGQFATPAAATAYAKQLHADQAAGEPTRTGSFAQDARVQRRLEDDAAQRNVNLAAPGGITAGIPAGQPGDPFKLSAAQTAAAIGTQIGDLAPHLASSAAQFVGGIAPDQPGLAADLIARSKEVSKSRLRPGSADYATAIPGLSMGDIAGLGENLAFSAPIMATAVAAGTLAPVLGAAAVPAMIAGVAAKIVSGGAAFWAAYRMAGNQFQRSLRESLDETRKAAGAKPISDAEWAASQQWWDPLAKAYGIYEGAGEGVGNVAALAILRSKVTSTLGRLFGKATATRFITKMGFGSTIEVLSEAETQLGQHNVEVQAGMTKGPERSFLSPKDQAESVREVAAPTLLQTAVFGAAAGGAHQIRRQATGEAQQELRDKVDARTRKWQTERADTTAADAIAKWGTQGLTPSTGAAPPAPPAAPPAPPAAPGAAAAPKAPAKPMPPPTAAPTVYAEDMPDLSRQNRDRGRAVSVGQIASIANAPDYDRAGVSNSSELGAPMVSVVGNAPTIPEAQIGREERVIFPDGKVPARYAVVEAGSVLASHTADGAPVAEYGKPAPGAVVALNNARTIGLTAGYARGTAASYRAALAADPRHGIAPEVIAGMKAPILVRLYDDKVNENMDLGRRSNAPHAMGLSGPERAMNDARLLDVGKLTRGQGDVLHDDNAAFIRSFIESVPANERADLTAADGTYSKQLRGRIEDALFARAYRSPELVSLAVENADPEIGNVLRAMRESAPAWARLPAMGELDLRTAAVHGAWALVDAKARGLKPTEVLRQADAFGTDPDQAWFTRMFVENNRSPKRMADYLRAVAEVAEVELSERGSMFEPATPKTKEQILGQATERTAAATQGAAKLPRRGQAAQDPGGRAGEGEQPGRGRTTPEGSGPVEVTDLPLAARIKRPTEDLSGGLFGEAPPAAPPKPAAPAPDYGLKSQTPAEIRAAAAAKEAAAKAAAKPPPATGPKVKADQADLLAPQATLFPEGTREPAPAAPFVIPGAGAARQPRTADGMPPRDRPLVLMFGGTFNPPTTAHVATAEAARAFAQSLGYKVERVLLVPSGDAHAKEKGGDQASSLADRTAMLHLAVQNSPGLEVADGPARETDSFPPEVKLKRPMAADWAARHYPGATIVAVTGEDQLVEGLRPPFPSIHMGEGKTHEGYFYMVLPRELDDPNAISSSAIRKQMRQGLPAPAGMASPAVEAYYRDKVLRPRGIKPVPQRVERATAENIVVNGKEYPLTWRIPAPPATLPAGHPLLVPTFARGLPPGALFDTEAEGSRAAERAAWRQQIIDKHFAGVTPVKGRRPIVFVMVGGGGSGKGWVKTKLRDHALVPRTDQNAVELDVDEIKVKADEWALFKAEKDGRAADTLHEESAALGKLIQTEARSRGVDFLLDATMANVESGLLQLQAWKDAGYEIRMHAVATDAQTAVVRAATRAAENNRWVPWSEILRAHKKLAAGLHSYAGNVDEFWIWDGNSSDPTLLAKSGATSVGLEVVDEPAYNRWRRDGQQIQVTTENADGFDQGEKTLRDVVGGISAHHQQDRDQSLFGEPRGPSIPRAGVRRYEEDRGPGEPGGVGPGRTDRPVTGGSDELRPDGEGRAPGSEPGALPPDAGGGNTPVLGQPVRGGNERPDRGPDDAGLSEGGEPAVPGSGVAPGSGAEDGQGASVRGNARLPIGPEIPAKSGRNYYFKPGDLTYEGGWLTKARQNVAAIKLLKELEAEGRQATPAEQAVLGLYTGWGASDLANNLFGTKMQAADKLRQTLRPIGYTWPNAKQAETIAVFDTSWGKLYDEVKALLSPEEWKEAAASTQFAHWTSAPVVRSMWAGVQRLGFHGGTVLEPGAGIGIFPGLMPSAMALNSAYTGIEIDPIAGGILKQMMPDERILVESFFGSALPPNFYDVAIGNWPFANIKVLADPEYKRHGFLLHDYFFAKTIDRLKPGGLMVAVTSHGTMDKANDAARKYLIERADLVAAVRLPQTAFKRNAGTEVVTDVLFLRKKVAGTEFEHAQPWAGTKEIDTPEGKAFVNEYFVAHPEMVLGSHSLKGTMRKADEYTVLPREGSIEDHFAAAIATLPENVFHGQAGTAAGAAQTQAFDLDPAKKKEGAYYLSKAGVLMQTRRGVGQRVDKQDPVIIDYVPLRDAVKQAHFDQLNDGPWEDSLKALVAAYKRFKAKHGRVNDFSTWTKMVLEEDPITGEEVEVERKYYRFKHHRKLESDPESVFVLALERINFEDDTISDGPPLQGRVLRKPTDPTIRTPQDALFAVLNERGKVDVAAMATKIGLTEAQVIDALGDAIWRTPSGYETADQYLSGNVTKKLHEAQAAAEVDRSYEKNVAALRAMLPTRLTHDKIDAELGMGWIPAKHIAAFLEAEGGVAATVKYSKATGLWVAEPGHGSWSANRNGTYSPNPTILATDVLAHALNKEPLAMYDYVRDTPTSKPRRVLNPEMTALANDALQRMRADFKRWVWSDDTRRDELTNYYNENFNTNVARQFDGRHLTLPGTALKFHGQIFDHVKRAIWRIVQNGNTYLAHAVGAGKTTEMIASAMEQKRLGLINKPMFIVPNHMLQQFMQEWMELYPASRLMVADEKGFDTSRRKEWVGRVALTDLDGVIMTHSSFKLLDVDPEFKVKLIEQQLDEFRAALAEVGGTEAQPTGRVTKKGKAAVAYSQDPTVKQIQAQIERLKQKLQAATSGVGRDQGALFTDLGVDMLYVDEAHLYRKLDFSTKRKVKGLSPEGSERAFDLWIKTRWLEDRSPGRSLVMASGTAITNTVAELYTVKRFMAPRALEEKGLQRFDDWATMFGREQTEVEPTVSGDYENVTRFSAFANVPEMTQMFRDFADVLTSDDLAKKIGDKRPQVKGGARQVHIAETDSYNDFKPVLKARVAASKAWKRSYAEPNNPDPIIAIIGDGRLASMDIRYMDPQAPNDPSSKLNVLADTVIERYHATANLEYPDKDGNPSKIKGATQMVFSDLGFGEGVIKKHGFDGRAWFTKRLIEGGVNPKHIAFMSDYKLGVKKQALFRDVNDGRVRILVGTTQSMGVGTNAQRRLIALHHMDTPWFPADLEQREGRIVRAGNKNRVVELHAYSTKGSYDQTMWQLVASKQRFIDQALSGDPNIRTIEDVSAESDFAMAAAMTSDDPRLMRLTGLRGELRRLSLMHRGFEETAERAGMDKRLNDAQIERIERRQLPQSEALAAKVEDLTGDKFHAKVGDQDFDKRKEWGAALVAEYKRLYDKITPDAVQIGTMSGFPIYFRGKLEKTEGKITYAADVALLVPELTKSYWLFAGTDADPVGLSVRATNIVADLATEPDRLRNQLSNLRDHNAAIEGKIGGKSPYLRELLDKQREVDELEADLLQGPTAAEPDYTLADYAAVGAGADLSGAAAMAARRPAAIEAAQLLSENRWEKVEEAREWLTDDRSHGDSYVAEAANEVYQAHGGERYGRSKAVLEYVTEAVERSRAMRAEDGEAVAVRGTNYPKALPHAETKKLAEAIVAGWTVKPKLEVLHSLDEAPAEVGAYFGKLDAKTTQGPVAAFFWRDTVYVLSNAMATRSDVIRYVQHEGLGHFGLRQTYGQAGMGKILTELVAIRGAEVKAKALAYGFDWNNPMDRGIAAEEYLVEMAETRPTMGFVKRAITAVRTWARLNVPGFESLKVTDAEIIREWILPARARIERGRPAIWPRALTRAAAAPARATRKAVAGRPVPPMPDVDALYPRTAPGASAEAKQQFDAYVAAMETWRRGLEAAAEGEDAIALKADDGKIRLVTANAHYGAVPDARPFRVTIIDGETWEPDYHTEHDTMAEALEGAAWDIRHSTKKTTFSQIPVAARALHAVAMGDEKGYSALDRRLIDYKPDRSLADAKETELIADTVPNARFVPYSAVPFFDQLNRLQGTPDPEQTSTQDYIDARYKLFNALPEIEAPMDKLVVTQDVVNRERIDSMMAKLPKQGGAPIMAVRYGGETYILDGHHRVVAKDKRGDGVVNARLLNLDAPATEVPRAARVRSAMQTVADLFTEPRIPLAKPTRVGDPYGNVDHPLVFSSGMSRASDFGPALGASHSIGVDVGEVSANAAAAIAQGMARSNGFLYVDSGAFALFRAQQRAQKAEDRADLAKLAKQIQPLNFDQVFARYDRLAEAISRADPDGYASDRVFYTMPDVIGDQQASLDLLRRFKKDTHSWIRHMQTVVPLQAGELSLTGYYDEVVKILGREILTVGIPSAAKAVSDEDFAALLRDRGDNIFGVHILGAASEKTAGARLEVLRAAGFDGHVSLDANRLRGLWNKHSTRPEALDRLLYGMAPKRKGEAATPIHPARAAFLEDQVQVKADGPGAYSVSYRGRTATVVRNTELRGPAKWIAYANWDRYSVTDPMMTKAEAVGEATAMLQEAKPMAARTRAPEDRSGDLFLGSRTLAVSTPAEMEGLSPWDYETTKGEPTKAEAQAAADALAKLVGRVWLRTSYGYMNPGKLKYVGGVDGSLVHVATTSRFPGRRPSDGYHRLFMRDGKLFEHEAWGDRPEDDQWTRVYVLNAPFGPTAGESWGDKPGLTLADAPRAAHRVYGDVPQEIDSAATSRKQVPAAMKRVPWVRGQVNVDIGAGRFSDATEYLASLGVRNIEFDPYNRTPEENYEAIVGITDNGGVDTVTVLNVLNVIQEASSRNNVIRRAAKATKKGGVAYFQTYEGDGSGKGTRTRDGWQENRKTESYLDEIRVHFDRVERRGQVIEARGPRKVQGDTWVAPDGGVMFAHAAVAPGQAPGLRPSRGILDTALRVPMQVARLDKLTSATWDLVLELGGRMVPERVKAGVVSDYGVPADVTDRREIMESGLAKGTRQTQTILDKLATLTRAETRVLYQAATTPDAHLVDYYLRGLPAESRAVLLEIKALVRALGQEQVDLGYLPREVFARNEWSYLHRTYLDKEAQETDGEKRARLGQRRLLADAYKGRGISDSLAAAAIERVAPDWWGRKFPKGVATADLVGENFVRMELRDPPLPGMTRGKLKDVVYFPAGEPLPATLNPYSRDADGAIWTVRDVKGGDAIVHRDFMPAERERMGEIDDIRYAIAKTLHLAINNVEVGRFLKYLADKHSKVLPPAGAVTREGKDEGWARYGAWGANEWARVPETMLPGTSVKRYGALAGRWLPGAIWNEARGVVTWQRSIMPEWYQSLLRGWKISRTALSPTVHMNNIVSNFVFADWSNVDARHIARAAWTLLRSKSDPVAGALVADYMDNGGQAGTWALTDLQRQQLEPILKELLAGAGAGGPRPLVGLLVALQKARAGDFEAAWEAVKQGKGATAAAAAMRKMIHLYQGEDDLFRLAAFIKAREDGLNDHDAGHFARKAFLDYRINAPWIQAMRQTAFPFIAFTYRALPMLLHAGATQPWKLAKLLGVLGVLNALAYAMLGGDGDEEQERRWLPEEKAGRLWGVGPHKLMRMPWNNAQGDPVFLDVRRFIPIGDFFDTGQNHAAMPWLPVIVPAGPLATAAELLANRSQFTGQDIVQPNVGGVGGDTPAQAAAKIADHLFKSFAPNLMVPGPGTVLPVDRGQLQTYSWQTVLDALNGATDTFGRTVSVPQAIIGGVGIKIGAYSREAAGQRLQIETSKAIEQVRIDMRRTARQEQTGKVSTEDAAARQETNRAKIKAIQERVSERLP